MNTDNNPTPEQQPQRYRCTPARHPALPLHLGDVYITSALRAHVEGDANADAALMAALRLHQGGHWDRSALDQHDQRVNDEALDSGGRILTAWEITAHGRTERVYVITEAADDRGGRVTVLMLASDY